MRIIKAIVFEPVGCLAEFPAQEFHDIAAKLFGLPEKTDLSGSEAYWRLLEAMQTAESTLSSDEAAIAENLELQAVEQVELYEDVLPALSELRTMNIELLIASSLSSAAVSRFLDRFSLNVYFSAVWTRDNAGGIKVAPLAKAVQGAQIEPDHVMSLVDTADGLKVAKEVGTNSILMIDDPDKARRLAMQAPTGGVVSLRELPEVIKLVAENARLLNQS